MSVCQYLPMRVWHELHEDIGPLAVDDGLSDRKECSIDALHDSTQGQRGFRDPICKRSEQTGSVSELRSCVKLKV